MRKILTSPYDESIQAIFNFSRAIAHENFLDDVLNLIVTVTSKATYLNTCSVWLIDESVSPCEIRLKASQINTDLIKNQSLTLNEGVVGSVASCKRPIYVADVLKDPLFKEKQMAKKAGLVSMLGVPMIGHNSRVIGVLNCFTSQPHVFTDTEIKLMTDVADQAAKTIRDTELMVRRRLIQEELETHSLLDQARKVLMRRRGISSEEADGWIKKCSIESCKSIRKIADAILLSDESCVMSIA